MKDGSFSLMALASGLTQESGLSWFSHLFQVSVKEMLSPCTPCKNQKQFAQKLFQF